MQRRYFDFVLIGLVLLFAFLAASFAVRNSDFWLHLAGGRLLAEGRFPFGADPFAFTTENRYWANHAWLFDWLLYLIYARSGDQLAGVLVVLKALLVSLFALILLTIRRSDSRLGWPAACTLLAVLAMSPRLLLHSTCLSYFLLAVTLWLLWRPISRAESVSDGQSVPTASGSNGVFRQQVRHYLPLFLIFVVWVNVDGWFLLGPLMAGLFWVGDSIAPGSMPRETRRTPGWVCLAGLAVCLINPYHLHAFTLPAELMPLPEALRQDIRFAPLHFSSGQTSLYYRPLSGVSLAGGAYLSLLIVGALSFLLNLRNFTGWRLLVWLTFAGLSAFLARTIPFFAVVAAPIAALNFQDGFSQREGTGIRWFAGTSYFSLVVSALLLIGLAWPGWLQGFHDSGHHVDWAMHPDSSLKRVAETLRDLRSQGKLGNGRGFLYHPSLVHYCAYFCPEEKGFLDHRLSLFAAVADDYEEICQSLTPGARSGRDVLPFVWRSRLSDWGITHLVLYEPSRLRLFPALTQIAKEKSDWTLLDIDGQALIIGWRDHEQSRPSGVQPFDAERLAFAPREADENAALKGEAPGEGPRRGPRPNDVWSHFGKPVAASPWQSEAAAVLLDYFNARAPYESKKRLDWTLSLLGLPALSSGSLDGLFRLAVHIGNAPWGSPGLGQQSPALPLLAVRGARQALAENPDDGNAYLQLGLAYLHLARQTPENVVLGLVRPLAELRHIQIAAALENALRCDLQSLDSLTAHQELAVLYEGRSPPFLNPPFLDAALEHRRAVLQLARQIGPFPGEDADGFTRRIKQIEREIQDRELFVRDRKNEFTLQTRNLGSEPYRKADLATRMGLGRLALEDVLLPSSIVLLGGEGVRLQVRLQMMLGQLDLIREQMSNPDWKANKTTLGLISLEIPGSSAALPYRLPAYEWLLLCQTAADGDYDEAQDDLVELLRMLSPQQQESMRRDFRDMLVRGIGREILLRAAHQPVARGIVQEARLGLIEQLHRLSESIKELTRAQLMLQLIYGMLALERGQPQEAKAAFAQARNLSRKGPDPLSSDPSASLVETYLRIMTSAQRR